LQKDRQSISKVISLLPAEIYDEITSAQFITTSNECFQKLDTDNNKSLSPDELYPVVMELCQAHPYSIDYEHCVEFTKIFDIDGNGVIGKDEFLDFVRFLGVMSYLQSPAGKEKANDALKILDDSQQIEDLLAQLKENKREVARVMPYLPEDLQDELLSKRFAHKCIDRFNKLDKDGNGSLDHTELFTVVLEMAGTHQYALDLEQCQRFTAIFDDEKTGVISKLEFVNFARFLMIMSFLTTDDGKQVLQIAAYAEKENATQQSPPVQTLTRVKADTTQNTSKGEIVVSGGAQIKHLTLEIEFYQKKSDKLTSENQALRTKVFEMEQTMRKMDSSMEEQNKLLRHAEIELQAGKR